MSADSLLVLPPQLPQQPLPLPPAAGKPLPAQPAAPKVVHKIPSHLHPRFIVQELVADKPAIHPLTELKNRIVRGDAFVFNDNNIVYDLWRDVVEFLKRILRAVGDFFGYSTEGLEPVEQDGSFQSRYTLTQQARKLLGHQKADDLKLIDFVVDYLNSYEKEQQWAKGIGEMPFQTKEAAELVEAIKSRLEPHMALEKKQLKLGRMIEQRKELRTRLEGPATDAERAELKGKLAELNKQLREAKKKAHAHLGLHRLERHLLAFHDRELQQNAIMQRRHNPNYLKDKAWLEESVASWKKGVKPKLAETDEIAKDEANKIQDLLCYPDILKLLRKDPVSRESIYKLVFRNIRGKCTDAAHIATQFPATSEELATAFLDKREGRLGGFLTMTEEVQHGAEFRLKKQVRFKMNGEHVPLNDRDRKIAFSPDYSCTVGDVLKSFVKKNKDIGEFECVQDKGIVRIHPLRLDLSQADWYKNIPVFETLNEAEMRERYGRVPNEALIVVKASRQHDSKIGVRVDDTHAWLQVVIPDEAREGHFKVYPFGKYADPMPQGFFDKMFFVFNTQLGVVRAADENEFFNQRQQQSVVLDASMTQALRVFDKVKKGLLDEQTKDDVFQAQGDNCAAWVKSTVNYAYEDNPELREQLKDLYEVSWLECDANNSIIAGIQYVAKNISMTLGDIMRLVFSVLMGACRSFSTGNFGTRRLIQHADFLAGKALIPAQLFRQASEINKRLAARPQIV